MSVVKFAQKIQIELIKLLYKQLSVPLWAESFAAIGLYVALQGAINSNLLNAWLILNLFFCGLVRHILVFSFNQSVAKSGDDYNKMFFWLVLFGITVFIDGIIWGAIGSILMIQNDLMRQAFSVFLLVGVTAAANPIYSPNRIIYALFLFPAFMPFVVWLLSQGGIFLIMGLLAFLYILVMLVTSFYSNLLISTSLKLRFENTDLVENLSIAKEDLEKRTKDLEKLLSTVKATLESTTEGILVVDSNNRIEDFNKKFTDMWKIPPSLLRDFKEMVKFVSNQLENPITFSEKIMELSFNKEEDSFDELLFKDGRVFECSSLPQRIGNKCVGRVWSFHDVTLRKTLEAKLFRQANYDALTGLPNRALLFDRTFQAIAHARLEKCNLAILFLDLDRFKVINDTLGHGLGDKLLVAIAVRLNDCLGENTVSRGGGDEFIVIYNNLKNEVDIIEIATQINHAMHEPFQIDGHKINITVSIGISMYPKDGREPELLIRNADIAMYHAKESGRNNFQFFTEEMNKKVMTRLVMESQLREALEQNEFSLVYQPIVSLKTGEIVSLEALLRWSHPRLVSIPPDDFISLAEESGVILEIGEWTLRNACKQARQLELQGFTNLQIAVNLSSRQFKQNYFLNMIYAILQETKLDPRFLSLELTEHILMDDVDKTIEVLKELKRIGINVVIDDFGTGYSSLNYLKRLPVEKLKIDRSFIQDIPMHADDAAITAAIIALAAKLNLKVIAEGVENQSQLDFLIKHHCDEVQGFFFSEPLEPKECIQLLHQNKKMPFLL